jgi:hypothetical protein
MKRNGKILLFWRGFPALYRRIILLLTNIPNPL